MSQTLVANHLPETKIPQRLAIIGEGPAEEDCVRGKPFGSNSYNLLKGVLSSLGIPLDHVFLGYVSTRRSSNSWNLQSIESGSVQEAVGRLKTDLAKFKPHCCLLLGDLAYKVFGGQHSVYVDRGSIRHSLEFDCKWVATYEPGAVMRNFSWFTFFKFDVIRAINQSRIPDYEPPAFNLSVRPTFGELLERLNHILETKPRITFDLEGHPNQVGVTCYSIATTNRSAFIVPFRNMDNTPFWSLDEETELWRLTAAILSDPDIPKVAQNGMYELFVFAWRHKILVRGLVDDTLYQMWETYCELPKDLATIGSLFTEVPYYKDERTVPDLEVHHEYCCKDSIVTAQACDKLTAGLSRNARSYEHYKFNIRVMRPYLYMTLRGCKLDTDLLSTRRANCWDLIKQQQEIVNQMTGMCLNVKSSPQKAKYLYGELGLPEQYKYERGQKKVTTNLDALSKLYVKTQLPVILEIVKLVRLRTRFSDLHKLQPFADGRMRSQLNPVGTDTGRLSSSATWVEGLEQKPEISFKSTKDGKVLSLKYKNAIGELGTNLQNVTEELRDLFIPDREDFLFFQYDLSGADAWTVAADLMALGNEKMMVHLKHKIKPSIVILLLVEHGSEVYRWSLDELKRRHDEMKHLVTTVPRLKNNYTASKACQHGTNYGMQPPLMASLLLQRAVAAWVDNFNAGIVDDIDFKITSPHIMERFQNLYIDYYGINLRNEYIKRQLTNHGYLDAASGARRKFTNIRNQRSVDDSIVRAAAAHEPQANTTFATNAALANMYYDRENRTARGNLRCEPLLMVHDALAGQAHQSQHPWAEQKMNDWFNIPLTIHGVDLVIPVEGGWGKNWKDTK